MVPRKVEMFVMLCLIQTITAPHQFYTILLLDTRQFLDSSNVLFLALACQYSKIKHPARCKYLRYTV